MHCLQPSKYKEQGYCKHGDRWPDYIATLNNHGDVAAVPGQYILAEISWYKGNQNKRTVDVHCNHIIKTRISIHWCICWDLQTNGISDIIIYIIRVISIAFTIWVNITREGFKMEPVIIHWKEYNFQLFCHFLIWITNAFPCEYLPILDWDILNHSRNLFQFKGQTSLALSNEIIK